MRPPALISGIFVVTVVVGAWQAAQPPLGGPLGRPQVIESTTIGLAPGQTYSWGIGITNGSTTDVIVRDVRLVGAQGIDVVGIALEDPSANGVGVGAMLGYPPVGEGRAIILTPLAGARLPPQAPRYVVVGFKLTEPTMEGAVDAIEIRYRAAGWPHVTRVMHGLSAQPAE